MGAKLQHIVDPLAINRAYFREKGKRLPVPRLFNIEDLVNTMLEQRHRESIKKTMLMHEDLFRQQVRELHRLYRVQRLLMDNLGNHTRQRGRNICLNMNNSSFGRQNQLKFEYGIQVQTVRDANPSSQECTASCSAEPIRIPKRFDLQRPAEENMSTGVSANAEEQIGPAITNMPLIEANAEANDDGSDEGSNGNEVELTLSIGPSKVMRRSESYKNHSSSSGSIKKESRKECTNTGDHNLVSSSSTMFNQESKRPHWLFQDLSLNRT